ncbi:MAG: hypothetical protein LBM72_01375 [Mycoplasmataceae bacterium]|jgi:hypothetical protein|nr:hypothetical protein [Mycoplasmataceae bacterium]
MKKDKPVKEHKPLDELTKRRIVYLSVAGGIALLCLIAMIICIVYLR